MKTPTTPRPAAGSVWADLCATADRLDAYREGQLAEQRHAFLDLDADSACCPPGFVCPNVTPAARIQRKRVKGWRKPGNAVIVTRGSRWGNPFTVEDCLDANWADNTEDARKVCAESFRHWLDGSLYGGPGPEGTSWSMERRDWIRDHISDLRGRDLACYCPLPEPGQPDHCHAAVLLELANREGGAR